MSAGSPLRAQLRRLVPAQARSGLRTARSLARLAWRDVRHDLLGQRFPPRPRAVSFMANDICNAKCVMCGIWGRKRERELDPDEVAALARSPLFSEVRHVGITGGEPTLRRDLPALYAAFADHAPRLANASIITNAIKREQVTERVLASAEACRERGVGFSVMVSLDGVGEVHDRSRGRPGNFDTAMACIADFRDAGLPVSIGCTITRVNVAHVDAVLDWAIENAIPARFRVAEFIDRLYNADRADVVRSFTPVERHHLGLFFQRLNLDYERDSGVRATYASIIGMLTEGAPRTAGCSHHTETVVLDARGGLSWCSPKSKVLGNAVDTTDVSALWRGGLAERRRLIASDCDQCIHDYHVPVSFRAKVGTWFEHQRRHRRYDCERLVSASRRVREAAPATDEADSVLIVGWYGTETAGDKAILASVLADLRARHRPPARIVVSSYNPWFTRWTLEELGESGVELVEPCSRAFENAASTVDEVLVGGGPLMDLEGLNHMLHGAIAAAKRRATVSVVGCGLGPLNVPRYRATVGELLRVASRVSVRDAASARLAHELSGRSAEVVEDPAARHVRAWQASQRAALSLPAVALRSGGNDDARAQDDDRPASARARETVVCCLRELPRVYAQRLDDAGFEARSAQLERALVTWLAAQVRDHGRRVRLLAMGTLADGGDDRRFNARLARALLAQEGVGPDDVDAPSLPLPVADILSGLEASSLALCMRYHAVLFAHELGIKFHALDYTGGGKVAGYLADRDASERLWTLDAFIAANAGADAGAGGNTNAEAGTRADVPTGASRD